MPNFYKLAGTNKIKYILRIYCALLYLEKYGAVG